MTAKNSSLAIGSFIVGAIVLSFAALIFFSGGRIFTAKEKVIMYYVGSVQGLQVGAPIKLKGVVIGEITDIQLNFQTSDKAITTPETIVTAVTGELVMKRINIRGSSAKDEFFNDAIAQGLRGQLNYQSFLTGLLYIELDFHPDTPAHFYKLRDDIRELPTKATGLEEIAKTLQELNLKGIVTNLDQIAEGVNKLVNSGRIEKAIASVDDAATSVKQTSDNINLLTLRLNNTQQEADKLLRELNARAPELTQSANQSLEDFRNTLATFNQTASTIDNTFAEDTQLMNQLNTTLEDISRAAQAFRGLSETLEQQPEALLRGRKLQEEKK
jgi:paraquat-inducible protein B